MTQTRRHSFLESVSNTLTGIVLAFGISQLAHHYQYFIQLHVWHGFKWDLSPGSNLIMTLLLTVVSIIRSYSVRRCFNKLSGVKQ